MFVSGFLPTTASGFFFFTTTLLFLCIFSSHPTCLVPSHSQAQFKSDQLFLHPPLSLYTCQPLLSCLCLCSSLALGMVRLDAEEGENPTGGAQMGGALRPGRKSACGAGFRIFHRNPDVWASFIRKKFGSNAHTVQRHRLLYRRKRVMVWSCGNFNSFFLSFFFLSSARFIESKFNLHFQVSNVSSELCFQKLGFG